MEELGAVAKRAPPLRNPEDQESLWRVLEDGTLPMVASDHFPAPVDLKTGADFFGAWGGIFGCQSLLPLVLSEAHHARGMSLERIADTTAGFPARRFGLAGKGRLEVGGDADLALLELDLECTLEAKDLFYRHSHSPYVGRSMKGRVQSTLVRGTTVFRDGEIVSKPIGRLITPLSRGR